MNIYMRPRKLDICMNRHEFQNSSLYHLNYWILKMDQLRSPNRCSRKNSSFNWKQGAFILAKYEQSKSIKEVQRAFRKKFHPKNLRQVPNILTFTRILLRYKEESALLPQVAAGKSSEQLRNNIEAVKKIPSKIQKVR